MNIKSILLAFLSFFLFMMFTSPAIATSNKPVILYTDILSGPNTGGEDSTGDGIGDGIYLSIFGKNFGNDPSKIRVTIGGGEVAAIKYLGPSYGRPDVQWLAVQIGNNAQTGPIIVEVDGQSSNTDHIFTVRPGDIYFVDNTIPDGSDGNGDGEIGNINKPFRYPQKTYERPDFGPGDFMILRGTGKDWDFEDRGYRFLTIKYSNKGENNNPFVVYGYPGEEVNIPRKRDVNKPVISLLGEANGHVVLANFRITKDGTDFVLGGSKVAINIGTLVTPEIINVRVVNLEISGSEATKNSAIPLGGDGGARNCKFLGLHFYDNFNSAYYISHSHDIEIAWNYIEGNVEGKGIRTRNGDNNPIPVYNIKIHDNLIHDTDESCIQLGDGTLSGIEIYNNILYNCAKTTTYNAPIRISNVGSTTNIEAKIFNNLLYTNNRDAITLAESPKAEIRNNIFYITNDGKYINGTGTLSGSHNIYYGSTQTIPSWDTNPIILTNQEAQNLFIDLANYDFHLREGSKAIDAGIDLSSYFSIDFDGNLRPMDGNNDGTAEFDIGPYEYTGTYIPPTYQCSDGTDNDGDGLTDYPSDPGCSSSTDDDEYNTVTDNIPPSPPTLTIR